MTASPRIRAYVVDDEPLATRRMCRLLDETGRVEVIGSANDPEEALAFLTRHPDRVDAVFLDIEMPEMTGFELLARLPVQPLVVFTTAYDAYALQAFEVHSIDYLLKPIDDSALERALSKLERLRRLPRGELDAEIASLMQRLSATFVTRLASRVGDRTRILDVASISHVYAEDKLVYAVVAGQAHIIDESITALERKLDPRQFVRIHRATLVNLAFVSELDRAGGGALVRLGDGKNTTLSVARDRVRTLEERLGI